MKTWNIVAIGISVLALIVLVFCIFSYRNISKVDNSTISSLDLHRYLGQWYEIARMDHSFERGMTHCTANYTLREDGTVQVINRGVSNGDPRMSEGKAKLTDTPGLLRVSFFGPFYADYRILMLADDYSYALIGGSGDDYLWILSRTPTLPYDVREQILREAQRRGYNTDDLTWVIQMHDTPTNCCNDANGCYDKNKSDCCEDDPYDHCTTTRCDDDRDDMCGDTGDD